MAGIGADLEPGTLLLAYRRGLFPMRLEEHGALAWWSPNPRGILPLEGFRISRSLRRSIGRLPVTVDRAFGRVIRACATAPRPGTWIDDAFVRAYTELHRLGWAHSVEVWAGDPGDDLVGGLYGVAVGGLFSGESMFHRVPDASKVALAHLVERMRAGGGALLDVQWVTAHLESLGAVAITRDEYGALLVDALTRPQLEL